MFKKAKKLHDDPVVLEISLNKKYKFMYENFVVSTQHHVYLLLEKSGDEIFGLKFNSSVYKYGYPNDEVGHPLSQFGLARYGFYEVRNSPWVLEIRGNNRSHPRDADYLHDGKKHFIIGFKDVTFEVIARAFEETIITPTELALLVESELSLLES
jgi:hypothetical protein